MKYKLKRAVGSSHLANFNQKSTIMSRDAVAPSAIETPVYI